MALLRTDLLLCLSAAHCCDDTRNATVSMARSAVLMFIVIGIVMVQKT